MDEEAPLLPALSNKFQCKDPQQQHEQTESTELSQKKWSATIGYSAMVFAALSFSAAAVLLRTSEKMYNMPSDSALFLAFSSSTITILTYATFITGIRTVLSVTPYQSIFVGIRAITGTISAWLFVKAAGLAPIGDVSAAYNVCPAMTIVFAAIILRERIRFTHALSIILSLFGVFLITRPVSSSTNMMMFQNNAAHMKGTLLAVASGTCAALSYVSLRHLREQIHYLTPAFFFLPTCTLFAFIVGGVPSYSQFQSYGMGSVAILLSGVFTTVGQVLLSIGLQRCPAGPAIIIRNLEVPLEYVIALLFLNEVPTTLRIFAACLIVSSTVMVGIVNLSRT